MLGIVIVASMQAIQYAQITNTRITNTASAVTTSISGIELLKHFVSESETNMEIHDVGSGLSQNCIEMSKTEAGVTSQFSVLIDNSDNASDLYSLYKLDSACPGSIPSDLPAAFSSDVFKFDDSTLPFNGLGEANDDDSDSNSEFAQVEFTFSAQTGTGRVAGGINEQSVILAIAETPDVACNITTVYGSWFSDFGSNLITAATVSINLNFESTDRVTYSGDDSDITATALNDIGVLHLASEAGKTVDQWAVVFSDVAYSSTATSISASSPPKRFAYSLGPGLPYTVGGIPSPHFYLAKELSTNTNYNNARDDAADTCYPEFTTDSNFLGVDASMSCSPRLTGHLPTISQEGEDEFIRNKVLKMVYPNTKPSEGMFGSVDKDPTDGSFWLGGRFNVDSDSSCSDDFFRWEDGFEVVKGDKARFANRCWDSSSSFYGRLRGDSAGFYWNSINEDSDLDNSSNNGFKLVYSIADLDSGSPEKYWMIDNGSDEDRDLLVIEFGDNRNLGDTDGDGDDDGDDDDESALNAALKLIHEVSIVPAEFTEQCE